MNDFKTSVMLYCVGRNKKCTYRWESFPPSDIVPTISTPVIYVSKPVLCRCTIFGGYMFYWLRWIYVIILYYPVLDAGRQCKGKMISFSVNPDVSGLMKMYTPANLLRVFFILVYSFVCLTPPPANVNTGILD